MERYLDTYNNYISQILQLYIRHNKFYHLLFTNVCQIALMLRIILVIIYKNRILME